jgi:hypothetical protein
MDRLDDHYDKYLDGYYAGIEAAAKLAASKACVNDMNWPRNIANDIIGLLRSLPSRSDG